MKKTFIRRVTSALIAIMMVTMPIPSGSFNIETDLATAEAAETSVTNIDTETNSESGGGVKSSSPETTTERGGFPDGTGEPSETTAPAETSVTSVTEPPAETEVTTVTGETSAETTAPTEDTSGDASNADETDMNNQETSVTDDTEETEQDEIDLLELEQHTHNNVVFEPWEEETSLPTESGNYYLSGNVSGSDLNVEDKTISLCLNGHNISRVHLKNATLNIYDETGAGKISGIVCQGGATLNIYGGTLEDSGSSLNLNNRTNIPDVVHIYGGTINGGTVSAINIEGSSDTVEISEGTINGGINVVSGTLTISGEPTISGNYNVFYGAVAFYNNNSFYLSGSPTINGKSGSQALRAMGNNIININGKLTPKEPITIALPYEPKEETYLFAVMEDESYADASAFAAYDKGYTIVKNGKKLYLTKQEMHEHDEDGTEFTPWLDTDSLPTTSGSYYLTSDVYMSGAWNLQNDAEINLCLNGQTAYVRDGVQIVNFNTTLSIYDDDEKNGTFAGDIALAAGTLNVYGGNYQGEPTAISVISDESTLNLYGGTFKGYTCISCISGTTTISGGTYKGDILVNGNFSLAGDIDLEGKMDINGNPIHITKKLENEKIYKIVRYNDGPFAVMDDENFASAENFTPAVEGYTIVKIGNKLYMLKEPLHTHKDGKIFVPWNESNNLPTESGNYYLVNGVNLSSEWNAPAGETVICLNRNTITTNYNVLKVGAGANLVVYDEEAGTGGISGSGYTIKCVGGTVKINSGTISSSNEGIHNEGGTVIVNGGNVEGTSYGINNISGSVTVKGGSVSGTGPYGCGIFSSGTLVVNGNANISGNDGVMFQAGEFDLSGDPAISNIHLTDTPITINSELKNKEKYIIAMTYPDVFATGDFAKQSKDKFKPTDELTNDGYAITVTENGELALTRHEHNEIKFMPWESNDSLPNTAGNWYLTEDVKVTGYNGWKVPTGEVNLCLNGNTIDLSNLIYVSSGAALNIYDEPGNKGIITNSINMSGGSLSINGGTLKAKYGNNIEIVSNSNISITGGVLEGEIYCTAYAAFGENVITISGGTVNGIRFFDAANTTLNISGNAVINKRSGYDYAIFSSCKLNISSGTIDGISFFGQGFDLSGSPVINGKIHLADGKVITITDKLTNTASYVIDMEKPGLFAVMDNESYASADNFKSAVEDYKVVKNGKELYLTDHVHEDGTAFVPWTDTESLPNTAGNWYLTENVTLNKEWNPTGETNLCLNGHDVNGQIVLNTTSTLNIYDCQENAGTITSSATWGTIFINAAAAFVNIYGGNIENTGTGDGFDNGTAVYNCGSLNIYGGNISGNNYAVINTSGGGITVTGGTMTGGEYGIWFENDDIYFRLSGSPIISGVDADIFLNYEVKINIVGKLTGNYTIKKESPGVFTSGAPGNAAADNFAPSADMVGRGYEITEQDGEIALTLKKYKITYDHGTDGEGEIDSITKTHGDTVQLSSDKFTRLGYTQTGWTKTENGEKTYDFGEEYKDDKDIILYPAWEKNVIIFSPSEVNIKVGSQTMIQAQISPTGAPDDVVWSVADNNDNVIRIEQNSRYTVINVFALKEGTATLIASIDGGATTAECKINVTRTDSTVTPSADETVTYGDELTLSAAIEKDTSGISLMALEDHVEFFNGEKSLGSAEVINGKAELTVDVTKDKFSIGENKIKAVYGGSISLNGSESSEITVNVEKRTLTPSISGTKFEKEYNGKDSADDLGISIALGNVVEGDDVTASGTFTFNSKDVDYAKTITANNITLSGDDAGYYVLSETSLTHDGKITPAPISIPDSEFTYNGGKVLKITIDGVNNETVTATLTAASKNARTYEYGVTGAEGFYNVGLSSTNYSISTAGTLTINKRLAEIEWQKETSFVYDGKVKEVTADVTNAVDGDEFTIEYDGNKETNVGEYTAGITDLGNGNYTLDGAENVTLSWEISAVDREETNVTINYFNETLLTSSDMEYSIDGETWLPCTENMSVTAFGWNGKESLTVKFRYAADKNHTAGKVQNVTIPPRPAAPDISGMTVTKTQDSITVTEISGCEYSIDGVKWQNSGKFTELNAGTEYTVQIRTKAAENAFASFTAEKEIVTSDTSSGKTELKTGETVKTENGSITNNGKNVEIEDKNGQKTTVTLPDGASDSVEVDESGNVKVPDGSKVETGKTTVTLPNGGKISPNGTITADKVVTNDTTISGNEVTVTPDGNITVSENGTVQNGDTTVELPNGGTISPDGTITADKVVTGDKTIFGEEVTVDENGNITVSENGKVQTGDTTVTLPDGGKISSNGTITADKIVTDDKTVSGEEVTVDKDGNITVFGSGTVQTGDTTVELPNGGTVKPDGTITADKVVTGDKTISGDEVTVTPDGNITLPNGGIVKSEGGSETIIGKDGSIKNSKVSIGPVNNTDYYDTNGEAHSLNNGYIVLDIEPVKDIEIGSDISVIAAYDIRLLYNGKFEVQPNGTVKVTIAAPSGTDGTEKVLHVNENGFEDMNAEYDSNSETFSFETDHFSIYVIAGTETSDEPITPPSIPQTVPDRPSPAPAVTEKTEKTENSGDEEDVSSGAEIMSDDEKISEKVFENDGLQNIFVYLFAAGIAAIAIIAKRKRQK